MQVLFQKVGNWLAYKKRRPMMFVVIVTLAALVSVIPTINSYSINSAVAPSGPLVWFASHSLGVHEVDPQYSQACVTHDHYYPIGMPIDQSGWPLSFEYDIFTAHYNCLGTFYPVLFLIDFIIFVAAYAVLFVAVPWIVDKVRHNRQITKKRVLFVVIACVVSVFATYETSNILYIVGPDSGPPPILSAVTSGTYELPVRFPLCPSNNAIVDHEICNAAGACALTGISEPSDPRQAVQGWPLAYIYNSLDPCFWEAVYPLVFVADSLSYLAVVAAAGVGVMMLWRRRSTFGIR